MKYTHVLITRPRQSSEELAAMLDPLGPQSVVQPAFTYFPMDVNESQQETVEEMAHADSGDLVIFSSPRAVAFGLGQLPADLLFRAKVAAIGPATARALAAAGIRVGISPRQGYTSEALLNELGSEGLLQTGRTHCAFIIAAPGGRQKLGDSLSGLGWKVRMVMTYRSEPAELDKVALESLSEASGLLSIWTSANAMNALSQRLPPATWFQICRGDWLVISNRLKRLARAFGPAHTHLAQGPGNTELLAAVRALL